MDLTTQQLYRHYKNKLYKYLGIVKHSETLEEFVLYKTLYKNLESDLWVRPKKMFFDEIEIEGIKKPRFEPILFQYQMYNTLSNEKIKKQITELAQSVFSDFDENKIALKLKNKNNILILVVYESTKVESSKIIGFKIGFETSNEVFYSWLGAIDPNYRNLGIGRELLKKQHKWCETMGYKFIETKTKNQWKEMLLLNIKSGFDVFGTEFDSKKELKILLRKKMN